jgi:hypothetical protein
MQGYKHRAASLCREESVPVNLSEGSSRLEVLKMIKRLKDDYDAYLSFTILDTRVHRARVYFNPERTAYILLYEMHKTGEVLRSLPHCDKKELVDNFRRDNLVFVRHVSSG